MDVVWSDPPPARHLWATRLAPLVQRPGCWALVEEYDSPDGAYAASTDLRTGRRKAPPGVWSFRSGPVADRPRRTWGLWARYEDET